MDDPRLQRKIKTREQIREAIGARPRTKQVIMCHGTFDIVHPGHIRHLIYAKNKADILIASLTCDDHISKANFRPYIPESIRALNLAALELVDYIVIDRNPTPIENIQFLEPDFFAKGYEYFKDGLPVKTQEELAALALYGGEILFTPGDIVYSSSALIEAQLPDLSCEKLSTLMHEENISFSDLRHALKTFSSLKVHVLGDTIVDTYTYGSLIGSGTKTPTPSLKYQHHTDYVGGAAVVAKHLQKAGAQVSFSTILGDDPLKDFVIENLREAGVFCEAYIDKTRPTTRKNVFIADGYRLLKVDSVDNQTISDKILTKFSLEIQNAKADCYLFSDFRHGIFSKRTVPILTESIPNNCYKVADSQVASRWGNILEFQGFDLITPNEKEARFALGDQDSVIRPLALNLYQRANCKYQLLKLGERGIITYRDPKERRDGEMDPRAFFTVDSFVRNLVDAVGAGDALLAYATLTLKTTGSIVIASILGSMAAAAACESEGNNPVGPETVGKIIDFVEKRVQYG